MSENSMHHALFRHNMGNVFRMLTSIQTLARTLNESAADDNTQDDSYRIHTLAGDVRKHIHTLIEQCPKASECPGLAKSLEECERDTTDTYLITGAVGVVTGAALTTGEGEEGAVNL